MNRFPLKNGIRLFLIVALFLVTTIITSLGAVMNPASAQDSKPTIVLVHGAFAESSSWNGVLTQLIPRGYPVVAVANPLRGVKSDADYVASVLQDIEGSIVLVGHSYGGAVITNAVKDNENVKALVYVAGFAPDTGETAVELSGRYPGSTLGPTLAPPVELPDGGKDLYIQQDKFHAQFASYQSNPPLYPQWQAYFRQHQPPTLIVWGQNDPIFPSEGAYPYKNDLQTLEFHLLNTGHFALEECGDAIAAHIRRFMTTHVA